ncbi:MAG TPA: ATP-binding cassette domain-containing protein, partial [Euryarchaeota archaeon]|nr:ATP-binding cassette domain-containing protein [Euryarchaeota archaeon]
MNKQDILVEIENLVINFYTYNGIVRAIDGVDLIINKGETFGLVGETGCGKSVTAKAIMQLILTPPGKIEDGSVFFLEPGEVRKKRKLFDREAQKWYDNLPVEKKREEICDLSKKFMGFKRKKKKEELDEVESL